MGRASKTKIKMKRTYIRPESELIESTHEALLTAFSMDAKDDEVNNPTEIQSKGSNFLFDDDFDADKI